MNSKKIIIPSAFAFLLLAGTYFYITQNILITAIAIVLTAVLYYKTKNSGYDIQPEDEKRLYIFMAAVSALMLAARFYRIFSFPHDYFEDELTDIVDIYTKAVGGRNFFSYVNRQGAAMPLTPEVIYSFFLFLSGYNIDFLRIIPPLLVLATAIELFFLGRVLKDMRLGIILCFLYSASNLTVFTARELLANMFIPLFAVLFLLLFFLYLKKNDGRYFWTAWIVFFAGFFTYTSWILMVPFAAYLFYEYKKELGAKKLKTAAVLAAASVIIPVLAYLSNKGIVSWSISRTNITGENALFSFLSNIINLPLFFMLPKDSIWSTDKLAPFSFAEFLLLTGGVVLCISRIKDRFYRIFFTGFCISAFTLVISPYGNTIRHIMILPFSVIISGLFLYTLMKWRYSIYVITLSVLFFINSVFYMFLDWNNQLRTESRDVQIADYINKNYWSDDYLFIYTEIPLSRLIGDYTTFLHARIVFKKLPETGINRVLFVSSSLFRYRIRGIFPGIKMKYFYDNDNKDKLPIVLYDLDLSRDPGLKEYFFEMSKQISDVNEKWWELDYDSVVNKCEQYCEKTDRDPRIILKNTFLRYTELKALEMLKRSDDMNAVLFNKEKPMFITSDWSMKIAEALYAQGNFKDALIFAKMAAGDAPEWEDPKKAMQAIAAQGVH